MNISPCDEKQQCVNIACAASNLLRNASHRPNWAIHTVEPRWTCDHAQICGWRKCCACDCWKRSPFPFTYSVKAVRISHLALSLWIENRQTNEILQATFRSFSLQNLRGLHVLQHQHIIFHTVKRRGGGGNRWGRRKRFKKCTTRNRFHCIDRTTEYLRGLDALVIKIKNLNGEWWCHCDPPNYGRNTFRANAYCSVVGRKPLWDNLYECDKLEYMIITVCYMLARAKWPISINTFPAPASFDLTQPKQWLE